MSRVLYKELVLNDPYYKNWETIQKTEDVLEVKKNGNIHKYTFIEEMTYILTDVLKEELAVYRWDITEDKVNPIEYHLILSDKTIIAMYRQNEREWNFWVRSNGKTNGRIRLNFIAKTFRDHMMESNAFRLLSLTGTVDFTIDEIEEGDL